MGDQADRRATLDRRLALRRSSGDHFELTVSHSLKLSTFRHLSILLVSHANQRNRLSNLLRRMAEHMAG
jgi:hypothetical protein